MRWRTHTKGKRGGGRGGKASKQATTHGQPTEGEKHAYGAQESSDRFGLKRSQGRQVVLDRRRIAGIVINSGPIAILARRRLVANSSAVLSACFRPDLAVRVRRSLTITIGCHRRSLAVAVTVAFPFHRLVLVLECVDLLDKVEQALQRGLVMLFEQKKEFGGGE